MKHNQFKLWYLLATAVLAAVAGGTGYALAPDADPAAPPDPVVVTETVVETQPFDTTPYDTAIADLTAENAALQDALTLLAGSAEGDVPVVITPAVESANDPGGTSYWGDELDFSAGPVIPEGTMFVLVTSEPHAPLYTWNALNAEGYPVMEKLLPPEIYEYNNEGELVRKTCRYDYGTAILVQEELTRADGYSFFHKVVGPHCIGFFVDINQVIPVIEADDTPVVTEAPPDLIDNP